MQSFLEPEQPEVLRWWPLAALVVGLAVVLSVFTGYSEPVTAAASPNPTQQSRIQQTVTSLQGRLHRLPDDALGWAQLGTSYVELARITADASYYAKAQGALDKSLALRPAGNGPAMLGMGALANARHDFAAAKDWGLKALAVQPRSAEVYGVLADAYTQLGDEVGAMDAVQNMLDLKPNVASFTRASYFFETHGRPDDARMALDRALAAAGAPDEIAFCRYHLGELAFGSGDLDEAEKQYSQGLAVVQDQTLLQGQAKVAAARGDVDKALDGYRKLVTRAPLPQYIMEYGELLDAAGRADEAAAQFEILARQHKLMEAQGATDDLAAALMLADHGDKAEALRRAEAEWGRRRNVLVADALAWALHVNGRHAEALPYMEKAMASGWDNAMFAYHRGMIHLALGQLTDAEKYLARAVRTNPHFSVRHAPIAVRKLAELRSGR
ncbi:tetratricopeptide repeat protein [Kibdelosporangium persicum]|uniref:Lipopolysaccharide biosynthesis regulator YciM n=1 Tax=Kibdelosporangium persicum TaxID=2698649 RepID=A0ABX2EYP3_9PSEU|nr:tetratricopeptide repeat protein [Kibdelosporangium persicum]NRN64129.1 Lipopolysaccharide biosynthesis regulator YciM [Kibdelosporangium persicum]